jgi:hypothetical protein
MLQRVVPALGYTPTPLKPRHRSRNGAATAQVCRVRWPANLGAVQQLSAHGPRPPQPLCCKRGGGPLLLQQACATTAGGSTSEPLLPIPGRPGDAKYRPGRRLSARANSTELRERPGKWARPAGCRCGPRRRTVPHSGLSSLHSQAVPEREAITGGTLCEPIAPDTGAQREAITTAP